MNTWTGIYLPCAVEFLNGAELALDNELYNVAAANAYYAMFWAAQAIMRYVGIQRYEWSHGGLHHTFGLEAIKKRALIPRRVGEWFVTAYDLRRKAHYGADGVGIKETRRIVRHAAEMIAMVKEVIGE